MYNDRPPPRRVTYEKGIRIGGPGWFGRLLTVAVSAILFVVAAMLSIVLFAVLFAVGVVVVGYLWWKMRALRRQTVAFGDDGRTVDMDDGRTVDMEVVHKDSRDDDSAKR